MTPATIHYLHATAVTPDGRLHAEIAGRSDVRFWCERGWFDSVGPDQLRSHLEAVLPLLFVARMRAFYEMRTRQEGRVVRRPSERLRPRRADYDARLTAILATGEHGGITLSALGMRTFSAEMTGDARRLDEHPFCVAAGRAASAMAMSQFRQVLALKYELAGR